MLVIYTGKHPIWDFALAGIVCINCKTFSVAKHSGGKYLWDLEMKK